MIYSNSETSILTTDKNGVLPQFNVTLNTINKTMSVTTSSPTPSPSGDVSSRYAGSDGIMQKSEAVQAVMDYFSGIITKQQAIAVVMAYFNGEII